MNRFYMTSIMDSCDLDTPQVNQRAAQSLLRNREALLMMEVTSSPDDAVIVVVAVPVVAGRHEQVLEPQPI